MDNIELLPYLTTVIECRIELRYDDGAENIKNSREIFDRFGVGKIF
jgi:hypothetical protein